MKRTRIRIVIAALCLAALFACESPPDKIAATSGAAAQAAAKDGGATSRGDATAPPGIPPPPIPAPDNDPHCEAYVSTKTPLSTAWVDQQAATGACSANPPTVTVTNGVPSASILYAACTGIEGTTPTECTLTADMQTCVLDYWTKLCQHNSDCPAGTVCVSAAGVGDVPPQVSPQFGTCEKQCNVAGSAQCGRCDMICDRGVCGPPPPPPPP